MLMSGCVVQTRYVWYEAEKIINVVFTVWSVKLNVLVFNLCDNFSSYCKSIYILADVSFQHYIPLFVYLFSSQFLRNKKVFHIAMQILHVHCKNLRKWPKSKKAETGKTSHISPVRIFSLPLLKYDFLLI